MELKPVYEAGIAALIGAATALAVGALPPAGAAMAFIASVITQVATPALRSLPQLDGEDAWAACLVGASWLACTTQVAQFCLRVAGYAAPPFWASAAIVSVAVLCTKLKAVEDAITSS